jgi:hypothetical protein
MRNVFSLNIDEQFVDVCLLLNTQKRRVHY